METNIISPENPLIPDLPQLKPKVNSKIVIFVGLFLLSLILLVLTTIISNQKNKLPQNTLPTPKISQAPIITEIPKIAIPTEYQPIINQIDQEIKTQLEFSPPQIDENIGL